MSTTWGEVLSPYGEYISEIYLISSGHTSLIATTELDYSNPYNQTINYFYKFSQDNVNWSDWLSLENGTSNLFEGIDTTEVYIQFKVALYSSILSESPRHRGIKIAFYPYEYIYNVGDLKAYPKFWIRKMNTDGDIKLINKTNNQTMELTNLKSGEEVFIDTFDETIVSSLESQSVFRYDNHNDVWLQLEAGDNYLDSVGEFELDIRYYAPLLQD